MSEQIFSSVTVVGGAGFIGRHLVKYLQKQGLQVHVPAKGDEAWMDEPQGLVVWAAGYTADYADSPSATVEAHAGALARLIEGQRYEGLVYLSSIRLHDGVDDVVDEDTPLALDPSRPRHLYDLSKGLGEWLTMHCGGMRAKVARLACVYGDALDGGGFLDEVIERALDEEGGPVDVAPDSGRDYIHVDDVCAAIWAIATGGEHALYLVASGETVDNRTLLGVLGERAGVSFEAARASEGRSGPTYDVSRLVSELGVQPRPLSEGLDRVLTHQHNQRAMRSMMGVTQMPWM